MSSYFRTAVKEPTQSPEATSAEKTSSMKQFNTATCTKPCAVQQPSYSTITSSQTSTDKTAFTTTKQPSSKQAIATSFNLNFNQMDVKQIKAFISAWGVQVSIYRKPKLTQPAKAVAFMDLPTDPDFQNETTDEYLLRYLTLPAGKKILDPFQMASLSNNFFHFPPFGLMNIFNQLIMSKTDHNKSMLSSWRSFEEYNLCTNGHVQSLEVNTTEDLDGSFFVFVAGVTSAK